MVSTSASTIYSPALKMNWKRRLPVSSDIRYEEEEYTSQFNGGTLRRILGAVRPHWRMVAGFLVAVMTVSSIEAYITYLGKRIVDEAIVPQNHDALVSLLKLYGLIVFGFAIGVFTFIYLAGMLGQRVRYDLRKKVFNHLQDLSFSYFDNKPVGWIMSRV